ncbi:TIR domain-containing protein [Saccharopolyspora cebuensis]|uniref:TIR domain-containing protein n=1 Tax=Saccharopolyspora cebuensis TaxID=418759 RepID=A0ABV4CG58_9PSEU
MDREELESESAIRVFLSYAHADDELLDMVKYFKVSLEHVAFADRGRRLDVFFDRESIGWGDNWKGKIRGSIEGAMIFMPVVTRQYFDRAACREELLSFHGEAERLGVTSLILPVVVMGHSYISEDSQDVAARIISERQYRNLEDAWIEGPGSATWRRTMMQLARELVDAAELAEQKLSVDAGASTTPSMGDLDDTDAPGMAEVSEALEVFQRRGEALMLTMKNALAKLAESFNGAEGVQNMPAAEARAKMLEMAAQIGPYGAEFQEEARSFEAVVVETENLMRSYLEYIRQCGPRDLLEREYAALRSSAVGMEAFDEAEGMLSEFLKNLRPVEVSSAPMRKSLRGFRDGAKAVESAITMIKGWPALADETS